jgi:hypothetical protein
MNRSIALRCAAVALAAALLPTSLLSAQERAPESEPGAKPRVQMRLPARAAPAPAVRTAPAARGIALDLLGTGPQEWKCTEYESGAKTCECAGVIDCAKLIKSGKCDGGAVWEDPNDPSQGGCDLPSGK